MAAVSSNRSPSPVSTKSNPHSRTSESNSTVRRSFSGNPRSRPSILTNPKSFNPTTPASSPADFARRNSVGKEGVGFEEKEKENERCQNLKPGKVRSPAVSKCTKNFMSPTISAASKITASPRKKVLVEKNELLRTSVSFSDGKNLSDVTEDFDLKSDMGLTFNQNKNEASCHSEIADSNKGAAVLEVTSILKASKNDTDLNSRSQVPLNSQNASESLSEMMTMESNCTFIDTSSMKRPLCSSPSPVIAPLDADPSLPPYDPKTNYLSPRPQFLHYKPNPQIELHFNKEGGLGLRRGKRLEDSFMSENFSDTEVTGETQSEVLQKESEDASSAETIIEEESHVSETKPISLSEETVEAKRICKLQFFTKSKSISLVLVLLIACLSISVTDSPVVKSSVYKDLSFSELNHPSDLAAFATEKYDSFARNFKQWSAKSRSYLSNLIGILGEVNKLPPLQFDNLTALQEDLVVDEYLKVDHSENRSEGSYRQDELEHVKEGEVEIETWEEKGHPEVEADDNSEDASEGHGDQEIEELHMTIQAEEVLEAHTTSEEVQSVLIPRATEIQTEVEASEIKAEVVETGEFQGDNDLNSCAKIESTIPEAILESSSKKDVSFGGVQSSEALNPSLHMLEDEVLVHYMLQISLLVLSLAAATAFIYLKQGKTSSLNAVVQVDPLLAKKLISSPVSASTEHIYKDKPASQNWPTEIDVVGESSCPSELSSQKSSSYSEKGLKGANEAQSLERRPRKNSRRESLASSSEFSMDSPSYGSFTTYEKILSKHGCGDEETVTPVRRSSRIRHQVTSP